MITAGVDIGSVATKALLLREREILAAAVRPTGSRPKATAQAVLDLALAQAGLAAAEVGRVVSTGYGRRVVDFGDQTITEISACARGMAFLGSPGQPLRTLIDLGGQDIKIIALDERGEVGDFVMNDKCAAGTGRFLEVIAQALETPLAELGELGLRAGRAAAITATCTVFAESEIISLLAQDVPREEIVAGVHLSVAERILTLTRKLGLREAVAFNGGGAKNAGLRAALSAKLGVELFVPESPQFVNALGAAVTARRQAGADAL